MLGVEFINSKTWEKIPSLETGILMEERCRGMAEEGTGLPLRLAQAPVAINAPLDKH